METIHAHDMNIGSKLSADTAFFEDYANKMQMLRSVDPDVATQTMEEAIKFTGAKTQENCQIARIFKSSWDSSKGEVAQTYLHNQVKPGVGKIGSIFVLESGNEKINEAVRQIAATLAMHTAAMKPSFISMDEVPEEAKLQAIEESKDLAVQNMRADMPEKAKEKMFAGIEKSAVTKLYKRDVLYAQELATSDESMTVEKFLRQESERLQEEIKIKEWTLFAIK